MPSEDATVHVIDDDQAARDSLAFLLKTAKLPVKTYESASAFLDVATGVNRKMVPPAAFGRASISPPWASIMVREIDSPTPVPWGLVVTNG